MIDITSELDKFERDGICLWVEGDKLKFDAPSSAMTEERLLWLKTHKAQILAHLNAELKHLNAATVKRELCSPSQERFWLVQQIAEDVSAFNIPLIIRLTGILDSAKLIAQLEAIYKRHAVLRTKLLEHDGKVFQEVDDSRQFEVATQDITESALASWISTAVNKPFDLQTDILFRATLLKLSDTSHVLFTNFHHAIADGWSLGNFARELIEGYSGIAEKEISPEAYSYCDYSREMRSVDLDDELAYWQQALDNCSPGIDLPTDFPRTSKSALSCDQQEISLSKSLTEKLNFYCRNHKVTQSNVLLAVFKLLLSQYSGDKDLVVGVPVSGRTQSHHEKMIGCFINNVAIRSNIDYTTTFSEWISQVQNLALSALEHQRIPFDRVVDKLNPTRQEGRMPVFQTMFTLLNEMMPSATLGGLTIESVPWKRESTQYELTLRLEAYEGAISGYFEYASNLFSQKIILGLSQLYLHLLDKGISQPDLCLSALSVADEPHYKQWLMQWNKTDATFTNANSVGEVFRQVAYQYPAHPAVSMDGEVLSYQQLEHYSNQLAVALTRANFKNVVAVSLPRGLELAVSLLGVLKAGLIYLPLDPSLPEERLNQILSKVDLDAVITCEEYRNNFTKYTHNILLQDDVLETPRAAITQDGIHEFPIAVDLKQPAYLIFTSGTTGAPKGTLVSHESLINYSYSQNQKIAAKASDVFLQLASVGFDVFFEEVMGAWFSGAKLIFKGHGQDLISAKDMLNFIQENEISCINLTTAHWHTIVQEMKEQSMCLPPSLRMVIFGGEAVQPDKLAYWNQFSVPLLHLYGQTETCCDSTCYLHDPRLDKKSISLPLGRPLANTQIYVLDTFFNPVPKGAYGEIFIGGKGVALEYLGEPELSAKKFIADPFSGDSEGRLCRTGDRGRINFNDELEFAGRLDSQVKIRGYRIELIEVESVISTHESVLDVALKVHQASDGDKQIVAYCVVDQPNDNFKVTLKKYLLQFLPSYCVPAIFVWVDKIPLNQNGKVDKKALPNVDASAFASPLYKTPPRNEIEKELQNIWQEFLPIKNIGIDDSFFDLGGHSLIMSRIATRISSSFGLDVRISELFDAITIEDQGELILQKQMSECDETELLALLDNL